MQVDPALIERIYEAAALPDRWPAVLQDVADRVGAAGGVIIARSPAATTTVASPRVERHVADYAAEGWADDPLIAAPLFAEHHPGFRAESEVRTLDEIARLPVHLHFLGPRALSAGVGTVIQGALHDSLQIAIQGFATHPAAVAAVPALDRLRAPLARAISLSARLNEARSDAAVAALDLAGVAAAVVSADGRLRVVGRRFADRVGEAMIDRPGGLRFADRVLQARFAAALAGTGARSIAVVASGEQPACAIHVLPLHRGARELFGWDGVLLLLAEPANASVPGADLLRLLFDLTPAEARVARHLVEGRAPADAAGALGITDATVRVHLRRVFAKTGVRRQAELVRLLAGLGAPG